MVVILDLEDGRHRMLTFDESGFEEAAVTGLDALTTQVLARQPELILVNPRALNVSRRQLLDRLNRDPAAGLSYALDMLDATA